MNDRVTILWHIERMSETDPLTLHQADQRYLLPRRGDRK
jgi:hypothetical protein